MFNTNLSVCTYNMGAHISDYKRLHQAKDPNFGRFHKDKEAEQKFFANLDAEYQAGQRRDADKLLANTQTAAYCLQEVVSEERPLIQKLKEKNYTVVYYKDGKNPFDTAIALSNNRFKNIVNHSFKIQFGKNDTKDVAVAEATDKETGLKVTFVSAHIDGFDFSKRLTESDTERGDAMCRAIVDQIRKLKQSKIQIIGADMNADSELGVVRGSPLPLSARRFSILRGLDFTFRRPEFATNINPLDNAHKLRTIDYLFVKFLPKTILEKIKAIFCLFASRISYNCTGSQSFEFNPQAASSDHIPVHMQVKVYFSECYLKQLCSRIVGCLTRKPVAAYNSFPPILAWATGVMYVASPLSALGY